MLNSAPAIPIAVSSREINTTIILNTYFTVCQGKTGKSTTQRPHTLLQLSLLLSVVREISTTIIINAIIFYDVSKEKRKSTQKTHYSLLQLSPLLSVVGKTNTTLPHHGYQLHTHRRGDRSQTDRFPALARE